jgi:hypothetical protein
MINLRKSLAIFALLVLTASFFFVGCQAATQPNLIANPGFENLTYSFSLPSVGLWYSYGDCTTDGQIHSGAQGARVSYGVYVVQDFANGPAISSLAAFSVWLYHTTERSREFFDLRITTDGGIYDALSNQVFFSAALETWTQFDIKQFLLDAGASPTETIQQIKFGQYDSNEFDSTFIDDFNMQTVAPSALFDWRIYYTWAIYGLIIAGFVSIFIIVARAKIKQGEK